MKATIRRTAGFLILALLTGLLLGTVPAQAAAAGRYVSVGLFYGGDMLPTANLENEVGEGYQFGFWNDDGSFTPLAETSQTKITMLKDTNIYLSGGRYYDTKTAAAYETIGAYHLELDRKFDTYQAAFQEANQLPGGFAAWTSGTYTVRFGSYSKLTDAQAAAAAQRSETLTDGTTVSVSAVTTSAWGVAVAVTGTTTILFEYDTGEGTQFGVLPVSQAGEKTSTWFKGYLYHGGFRYQRLYGADLTVVNLVDLEDYVAGVVSREMSVNWPMEALKAGACAARTFVLASGKHQEGDFDICGTTCCQVYRGIYQDELYERAETAARETAGQAIRSEGRLIQALYYSSNGGASEASVNAWGTELPYLKALYDPFESLGDTPRSYWAYSYTRAQLTSLLRSKDYDCGSIVSAKVTKYTPIGNANEVVFTDANGETFTFSGDKVRLFEDSANGKYTSRKFTIIAPHQTGEFLEVTARTEDGDETKATVDLLADDVFLDDPQTQPVSQPQAEDTIPSQAAVEVDFSNDTAAVAGSNLGTMPAGIYYVYDGTDLVQTDVLYVMTTNGVVVASGQVPVTGTGVSPDDEPSDPEIGTTPETPSDPDAGIPATPPDYVPEVELTTITVENDSDDYLVVGSGWGHNVGMSQYGAKAMAELGYTYDQILKFYYTGVTVG